MSVTLLLSQSLALAKAPLRIHSLKDLQKISGSVGEFKQVIFGPSISEEDLLQCLESDKRIHSVSHLTIQRPLDLFSHERLVTELGKLKSVTHLNIRLAPDPHSQRTDQVQLLAHAFNSFNGIVSLKLKSSSIQELEAISLAKALEKNTSLESLDLESNSLYPGGGKVIATLILLHPRLAVVNLANNFIGYAAEEFIRVIQNDKTLEYLNLKDNAIAEKRIYPLLDALKDNRLLVSLDLSGNFVSPEKLPAIQKRLEEYLNRNKTQVWSKE